jgi:protein tyrosine phosphatase (PTP) superfamily phosphohydrolase (DUF442 family)
LPDEAGALDVLGLQYIHIPVEFDRPTDEDFGRFCVAMASLADKPIHVHCIANLRVTAFLYRWQRDVCGVDDLRSRVLMDSVWRPGGVWAAFIGDEASVSLDHRPPK